MYEQFCLEQQVGTQEYDQDASQHASAGVRMTKISLMVGSAKRSRSSETSKDPPHVSVTGRAVGDRKAVDTNHVVVPVPRGSDLAGPAPERTAGDPLKGLKRRVRTYRRESMSWWQAGVSPSFMLYSFGSVAGSRPDFAVSGCGVL